MPTVYARPQSLQNGDIVTEFRNTTLDSFVTYTYPEQQNKLEIENKGYADMIVNVGSYSNQIILPGQKLKLNVNFTYFEIRSTITSQEFYAKATIQGVVGSDPTLRQDINTLTSQLAQIAPGDAFDYSHFVTNMTSYLGVENKYLQGDGGTRFYILPRVKATTGLGGGLKIFGDPYHLQDVSNFDYRDLGIYFHGSQNGDIGVNGTGVFWINSKVLGTSYNGKNPDIGFSFQDGTVKAGRFIYTNKSGAGNSVFVVGHTLEGLQTILTDIKLALDGGIGFNDNSKAYIRWKDANEVASNKITYNPTNVEYTINGKPSFRVSSEKIEVLVNGNPLFEMSNSGVILNRPIISKQKLIVNSAVTTVDVSLYNRIKFGVGTAHSISNFTGVDGQQIRLLFAMNTTTIEHNTNIKLSGGVNFTPNANDVLVLENWDGVWYEVSRSVNG